MGPLAHYGLLVKITQNCKLLSVSANSLSQDQELTIFPVTDLPGRQAKLSPFLPTRHAVIKPFVVSIAGTGERSLCSCHTP